MPNHESFFRKLLKMRRQLDSMADVSHWRTWRERVCGPLQASSSLLSVFEDSCFASRRVLPVFYQVERMTENLQGDQPAKGAVQIPRELPFIYMWVTNDVLGTLSALDQQYLDELKLTGVLFGGTGWKLPAVGSGCAS
ncbi:hypothetical protein PIB30_062613 [Stylosanthes scabra]|uniref:Uncharacterized protein n=1 Tax=Stylosanthes scabra TaxID=79078 RepID=A0ABU6YK16_9FABA|nr:hypothetical protein [Stylosanthes scabra]